MSSNNILDVFLLSRVCSWSGTVSWQSLIFIQWTGAYSSDIKVSVKWGSEHLTYSHHGAMQLLASCFFSCGVKFATVALLCIQVMQIWQHRTIFVHGIKLQQSQRWIMLRESFFVCMCLSEKENEGNKLEAPKRCLCTSFIQMTLNSSFLAVYCHPFTTFCLQALNYAQIYLNAWVHLSAHMRPCGYATTMSCGCHAEQCSTTSLGFKSKSKWTMNKCNGIIIITLHYTVKWFNQLIIVASLLEGKQYRR